MKFTKRTLSYLNELMYVKIRFIDNKKEDNWCDGWIVDINNQYILLHNDMDFMIIPTKNITSISSYDVEDYDISFCHPHHLEELYKKYPKK